MKVRIFKKELREYGVTGIRSYGIMERYTERSRSALLLFFLFLAVQSCVEVSGQSEFEQQALQVPQNYTATTRLGVVSTTDPDDWRISPLYSQLVFISPAFPNPTNGDALSLEVNITATANLTGLQLFFINSSILERRFITSVPISRDSFFEVISFNPRIFSPTSLLSDARGLHRLLIYDNAGRLITYGDILVAL